VNDPAGAAVETWDCHVHVFDPAHPFAAPRAYTPEPATVEELAAHLSAVGAARAVLVQASPHGNDNSGILAALDRLGPRHRAVVAPEDGLDAARLAAMRARGVRGLRLNPMGGIDAVDDALVADLARAARLAADAGLALEISATPAALALLADTLAAAPGDIVVAHLAGLATSQAEPAVLARVRRLLAARRIWTKLSGFDRFGEGWPERVEAAVAFLAEALGDRIVWGSDWPHTPYHDGSAVADAQPAPRRRVDDVALKARLAATLGPAAAEAVFVANPARLYG
jgi:predicted TIM-barrel fold metal-dependent hydrolase